VTPLVVVALRQLLKYALQLQVIRWICFLNALPNGSVSALDETILLPAIGPDWTVCQSVLGEHHAELLGDAAAPIVGPNFGRDQRRAVRALRQETSVGSPRISSSSRSELTSTPRNITQSHIRSSVSMTPCADAGSEPPARPE
jgi:hypothetical protein